MELPDDVTEQVIQQIGKGVSSKVYKVQLFRNGELQYLAKKVILIGKQELWQKEVDRNMTARGLHNVIQMLYYKYKAGPPDTLEAQEVAHPTGATKSPPGINLGGDGGHGVIYFELCDNGDLKQYIDRERKTLSEERKKEKCLEVARGLQNLHTKKLVHGDLHTGNVMVTDNGEMKIGDLGCATRERGKGDTCKSADVADLRRLFVFIFTGIEFPRLKGITQTEQLPKELKECLANMLPGNPKAEEATWFTRTMAHVEEKCKIM